MEAPHLIFDLDGTLIDSRREMIDTYKQVFAQLPPVNDVDPETLDFGAALPVILESVYGKDELLKQKARTLFVEIYDHSAYESTSLYPGVAEALQQMHNDNFTLHIATNKRMTPVVNILKAKKVYDLFTSIKTSDMGGEQLLSKKAMVSATCGEFGIRKGCMVGDSIHDLEAGHDSGLATVAVLYGYEKKEELLKKNPTFVINHFKEILTYITQL